MTNTIITIAAITLLAAVTISISSPSTATGGGSVEVTGSSSEGEGGTTIGVYHDGDEMFSGVTITWDGNSFSIAIQVPEFDEKGDNLLDVVVVAGGESDTATMRITKN